MGATYREDTIARNQYGIQEPPFTKDAIQYFHSIDKEGRHVTIGKAEYHGTFGLTKFLMNHGDNYNPPIVLLPNTGEGYEYVARATCHPEDAYSPEKGEEIVRRRIYEKYHLDEAMFFGTCSDYLEKMSELVMGRYERSLARGKTLEEVMDI